MNSDFFLKYFYVGIVQSNLCWKIHNKYVFHVNIHIFVLKYLVQIQIIQNQFKISKGVKWNSHQMPCVYISRKVKNDRICPIRLEIIHGRHNSMPAMHYFLSMAQINHGASNIFLCLLMSPSIAPQLTLKNPPFFRDLCCIKHLL